MANGSGKKVQNQSVSSETKVKKARDVLMFDKYNVKATEILTNQALSLPITEAVPIYEQLLSMLPTSLMIQNNDVAAKQVFGRCLSNNRQIGLCRRYIHFTRKLHDKKGAEGQEEIKKAFEFMLNYYITFLKEVYQKAILTPTHHVEQLWKDYENFENSVSRALAKGQVSEYQPKYNSAKAVYKERKKLVDDIDWNMLAVPPTGSDKEEQQCMAWKRFLAFEKGNPQMIDSEFSNSRIILTYEQYLMYLYYYPDICSLPDSELLKYAYAELEESRGSLLGDVVNASTLAHIHFIPARKYFVDARKYPNCTYHVFVAYAMMAFCQDKDLKVAHNVFEAGMKRFMHEPAYILEYADFLCGLNDDRNVRALFERALNSLPPEKSVEGLEAYSFMGLWPCSSKDLDYLARQDCQFSQMENAKTSTISAKVNYPDTSRMIIYDPRQKQDAVVLPNTAVPELPAASNSVLPAPAAPLIGGTATTKSLTEILEVLPPALAAFVRHLPSVDGHARDVDIVLSILLQSNVPLVQTPIMSDPSGANKSRPNPGGLPFNSTKQIHSGVKRKDMDRQQNDETQSQPLPTDLFQIRQMKKAQGVPSSSQNGSASGSSGSSFSGELSGRFE
ncbi:hypothetical protein MKX01_030729 [Papaver californicum]|nr:hypothetical protein MKX01_030729 [Papaver californicum]